MRIRKDRVKEGLAKAYIEKFKDQFATGDTPKNGITKQPVSKITCGKVDDEVMSKIAVINDKISSTPVVGMTGIASDNASSKIPKEHNDESIKTVDKAADVAVKISGLDSDANDIALAVKYIMLLNNDVPLTAINIICNRYASLTTALVNKTLGKGLEIAPYQKQVMSVGSTRLDSAFFSKKGDKIMVYLNSAKRYAEKKNWYLNESIYNLAGIMALRQTDKNPKLNKDIESAIDNIKNGKITETISNDIIRVLGEEKIKELAGIVSIFKMWGSWTAFKDSIVSMLNQTLVEYNAHSVISEIRPEALQDVIYRCTETEFPYIKQFLTDGVSAEIPIEHEFSTEQVCVVQPDIVIQYLTKWVAIDRSLDELDIDDTVKKLTKILVKQIITINNNKEFNLIDFVIIWAYFEAMSIKHKK